MDWQFVHIRAWSCQETARGNCYGYVNEFAFLIITFGSCGEDVGRVKTRNKTLIDQEEVLIKKRLHPIGIMPKKKHSFTARSQRDFCGFCDDEPCLIDSIGHDLCWGPGMPGLAGACRRSRQMILCSGTC
jgi:hypothetical protein